MTERTMDRTCDMGTDGEKREQTDRKTDRQEQTEGITWTDRKIKQKRLTTYGPD